MKKFLLILCALSLAVTAAQAQTKITIGLFPDLDTHVRNVLPRFHEENPDIEVEMRVSEWGDHHNLLVTSLATGSGAADVEVVDAGYIARFVAEGGLADLTQPPFEAERHQDAFASYAVMQATASDGRIVAMPADLGPGVMFYRRDVVDEVDADIDEAIRSWDDFIEFGRQVTRDTDGDGRDDTFLINSAADVARAMIRSDIPEGEGTYFDADGNVLVNSERFHEAFRTASTIREEGLDARIGMWSNDWNEAVQQGDVAVQFSGAWLLGALRTWLAPDTAGLWGASNLPGGAYANWGGSFYAIPEQSDAKEAAWRLVEFLTTDPEVQLAAFEEIGAFPAVTSTYDDPAFDEPVPFLGDQPARRLFAEVAQNIEGVATNPNDQVAEEIVESALGQVLDEGRDIGEALAEAEMLIMRRTRR